MSGWVMPMGPWQLRTCVVCGAGMVTDRGSTTETCSDDCWEAWLEESERERYAAMPPIDPETRRRALALCAYRCPDHGCDLIECEDVDEQGVHVYYQCPAADHVFGSIHDPVGGYAPSDDDVPALAILRGDGL